MEATEEEIAEGTRMIMEASEGEIRRLLESIHGRKKLSREDRLFRAIQERSKKRAVVHAQHIRQSDHIAVFEKLQLQINKRPNPLDRAQWLAAKAAFDTIAMQLDTTAIQLV